MQLWLLLEALWDGWFPVVLVRLWQPLEALWDEWFRVVLVRLWQPLEALCRRGLGHPGEGRCRGRIGESSSFRCFASSAAGNCHVLKDELLTTLV